MIRANRPAPIAAPPAAPSNPCHPASAPKSKADSGPRQDNGVRNETRLKIDDADRQRKNRHDGELEGIDAPPEAPPEADEQQARSHLGPEISRADACMAVPALPTQEEIAPDRHEIESCQLMTAGRAD